MRGSRLWYLVLGGLLVTCVLLVALFAEQITTVSPYYVDAPRTILEGRLPLKPGPTHILGTDTFGRDLWSRLAFGTRWSLLLAVLIMGARLTLALPMGLAGAFGPRWAGWLVNKLYVYTSAVPPLLVYLLLLSNPRLRTIGLWPSVIITTAVTALLKLAPAVDRRGDCRHPAAGGVRRRPGQHATAGDHPHHGRQGDSLRVQAEQGEVAGEHPAAVHRPDQTGLSPHGG